MPKDVSDINWYYIKSDGVRVVEFLNIDGTFWYFDEGGVMMKGMVDINNKMYYFEEEPGKNEGKLVPAEEYINRIR